LPIAAVGIVFVFFKTLKLTQREKMFVNDKMPTSIVMYSHWIVIIKWVVPILVGAALVMSLVGVAIK
ncbi:MAG: sodium-dependent transporter, partial [Bdellovibrionaceae bacterium]|nr:sodium-dependent transporter [Pseudobdellovibrionaceae bacterium]